MALNYKLITRKVSDLKGGAKVEKVFANPAYYSKVELDDICKSISERSALSSADVKGVLDSLNYVLDEKLRAGAIVKMGELGNFHLSISSNGVEPGMKFNATSDIRKAHILFSPGKALRTTKANVRYSLLKDVGGVANGETGGGSDSESPDEI